MNHPQRFHALDNLRALMMWLGIVLHVAVNHMVGESPLPWRDRETSAAADFAVIFIHAFRMPVFFILAGFFAAMLAGRRGYGGMLKHRLRRIGLPFIVFWPPIFAGTVALVMLYVHLMVHGTLGFDLSIMPKDPGRPMISTMHMWFIYYLLWFCVFTYLLGLLSKTIPDQVKEAAAGFWGVLASRWWGFLVLAAPLAVVGSFYQSGIVPTSGSFVPQFTEIVHNGLFFLFGWYMYGHRESLLDLYSKNCWRYLAAGLFFFAVVLVLFGVLQKHPGKIPYAPLWIAFVYNCVSWLWSFALIGLFMRYLSNQNRFLRYVSESSYWVYLVHMLGTVGFGVALYNMPVNALAKMGINILATTLVCIATYHVFVRYTPVGTLLNGQRFKFGEQDKFDKAVSTV